MSKEKIEFAEFLEIEKKLEITIGQIENAERIPKSTKLIKLSVRFGNEDIKTVVTNLGADLEPEDFEGLVLPFITNLAPSTMMGVVSEAMIMVGKNHDTIELNDYSLGSKLL